MKNSKQEAMRSNVFLKKFSIYQFSKNTRSKTWIHMLKNATLVMSQIKNFG